jgi:hypothetical protein
MLNIHSIYPLVVKIVRYKDLKLQILPNKLDSCKYGSKLSFQLFKTTSCLKNDYIGHESF